VPHVRGLRHDRERLSRHVDCRVVGAAALVTGSTITITFGGSSVTGSSGCNGYGSRSARVSNGTLIMGETASSAMACMGPGVMEQEARFYALLNARPQIQVDGDTLLLTGQAMTMTFRRS
jgi:heat shock protein HslJ